MRQLSRAMKGQKQANPPSVGLPTNKLDASAHTTSSWFAPESSANATGMPPTGTPVDGRGSASAARPSARNLFPMVILLLVSIIALFLLNSVSAFKVIKPALTLGLLAAFLGALIYALFKLCLRLIRRGYIKLAGMLVLCILGIGSYSGASAYAISYDPLIEEALATRLPPATPRLFWIADPKGSIKPAPYELERRIGVEEIRSSWLKPAIIAVEDERLPSRLEGPVDLIALTRAALSNLRGHRQGGSTIQLQLAKLLLGKLKTRLSDKDTQTLLAIRLDQRFPEIDELLSLYCNVCSITGDSVGMAAAAAAIFGVYDLRTLTIGQSAVLAGMLRSPANFDPRRHPDNAKARRNLILGKMRDQHTISDEQYREALSESISYQDKSPSLKLFIRAAKVAQAL